MKKTIFITGCAGFIGFHLTKRLISHGFPVIGIDNLNDYYDVNLKKHRLSELKKLSINSNTPFIFQKGGIENFSTLEKLFKKIEEGEVKINKPEYIVNLAAQAGVRYSIENPSIYIKSNIVGFNNILELSRKYKVSHLIYASSSSVYGGNTKMPFSENDSVDHPISLYAASKKSNELMAHTYSSLYKIPATGLRFFTVYGPWGRPDMALFLFTKSILNNEPIEIFNYGEMIRDFTFIDDIIESLFKIIFKPATADDKFDKNNPNPGTSWVPHRVFNIGNSKPVSLMKYIEAIEDALGIKAKKNYLPMQPGDVKATASNTSALDDWIGFKPNTPIKIGVKKFVDWYKDFYLNN